MPHGSVGVDFEFAPKSSAPSATAGTDTSMDLEESSNPSLGHSLALNPRKEHKKKKKKKGKRIPSSKQNKSSSLSQNREKIARDLGREVVDYSHGIRCQFWQLDHFPFFSPEIATPSAGRPQVLRDGLLSSCSKHIPAPQVP